MVDADTLEAILDEHEPDTLTEVFALCAAKARLRKGADPADVLTMLEANRDAFEREHGLAATFDRVRELARRMATEPADDDWTREPGSGALPPAG